MTLTCLGCAHYARLKVRNQWITICRVTHKTAPMVACRWFFRRFGEPVDARAPEMAAELL